MRDLLFVSAIALAAIGCSKSQGGAGASAVEAKLPEVSIDQLDKMLANNDCVAVDANGEGTRKKMGVIPGAVLLTDSETYAATELPADKSKQLVFYCGGTKCTASDDAASKALTAGYTNVKILREGIAGWVKSGKQIQSI